MTPTTAGDVLKAIAFFGESTRRGATYADLGGDFSAADVYNEAIQDLQNIINAAKELQTELRQLRSHEHDWDDNSYCTLCGADGRA